MTDEGIPYQEAIKSLERIQEHTSPRDKIAALDECYGHMKTSIVDHWKGKIELCTMDDVLPLFIYVVSQADISHLASEIAFVEDFIRIYDKGFETE